MDTAYTTFVIINIRTASKIQKTHVSGNQVYGQVQK